MPRWLRILSAKLRRRFYSPVRIAKAQRTGGDAEETISTDSEQCPALVAGNDIDGGDHPRSGVDGGDRDNVPVKHVSNKADDALVFANTQMCLTAAEASTMPSLTNFGTNHIDLGDSFYRHSHMTVDFP